jgi:hypothetical protein
MCDDGNSTPNTPSGWNVLATNTTATLTCVVFQRTADGTEGATLSVSDNGQGSTVMGAFYVAVQSASGAPEATSTVATGTGTTATASSVTSLGANRLLLSYFTARGTNTMTVNSPLTAVTGDLNTGQEHLILGSQQVGSGATGSTTATIGASETWAAVNTVIPGTAGTTAGPLPNVVTRSQLHPSLLE